ncbi:MAG TPA: lytic transglycosylase domain-containing protein [Kiritimatiellia bacterium]|jgi:membrane-bound lytic murein transglycosylase D
MVIVRALVLSVLLFAATVRAQDVSEMVPAEWVSVGSEVLDVLQNTELDPSVVEAPPSLDEWREFWGSVDRALRADSVEELAWMLPEVETALAFLDAVPEGKPYADWLRQRLDYFTVADEVSGVARPEPRRSSLHSPPRPLLTGADKPSLRVAAMVRDTATWKGRVAKREPPASADELIPVLKEVFRDQGVPHQLVWVAEVESSLDPEARSPVGAAGLFQFMPETAKRFGLELLPDDERLHPEKSARAAARYLRFLHASFGSWPLALAAYNAGEGAVGRLLKKRNATTFEGIAAQLPVETQMYVPKVLATVSVREGVDASRLPGPAVAASRSEVTR